jgi:hypothetical protein
MPHGLHPAAFLAAVHSTAARIVVSGVSDRFVLRPRHTLFTPPVFRHSIKRNLGCVSKKLWWRPSVSSLPSDRAFISVGPDAPGAWNARGPFRPPARMRSSFHHWLPNSLGQRKSINMEKRPSENNAKIAAPAEHHARGHGQAE